MKFKNADLKKDGEILFKIDNDAFWRPFDYPARNVQEEVNYLKNCETVIIYEKNEPIGFVAYVTKRGSTEVKSIAVLPKWQGKGVGTKLFKHALKKIKKKPIYLVTHPKNSGAIIMYLKFGFEIYGWKDNYYGDGEPRLLLKLEE